MRGIKMRRDGVMELRLVERPVRVVAEVHDRAQVIEGLDHLALVRELGAREAVDEPATRIAGYDLADDVLELAARLDGHAR